MGRPVFSVVGGRDFAAQADNDSKIPVSEILYYEIMTAHEKWKTRAFQFVAWPESGRWKVGMLEYRFEGTIATKPVETRLRAWPQDVYATREEAGEILKKWSRQKTFGGVVREFLREDPLRDPKEDHLYEPPAITARDIPFALPERVSRQTIDKRLRMSPA